MSFTSGKNAKVRYGVGATTLKCKKWTVTPKAAKLDVTNSESAGYGEYVVGIHDVDIELEFDYDVGGAPYASGIFRAGTSISNLKLYQNDTTGPFWDITTAIVEEAPNTAEVRGLVSIRMKLYGTGSYVYPTT